MKVRALRGVCIGIERHLAADELADLEPSLVTFLVGIKAVEIVKDDPPPPTPEPEPIQSKPEKSGKSKEK